MSSILPYLIFDGECREAMEFYRTILGGELEVMTYADEPGNQGKPVPPEMEGRLIHAMLSGGASTLMASDSMPGQPVTRGDQVWLYLPCDSDEQVAERFEKLAEGGREVQRPHDAFWGSRFAMASDRFGNHWMLAHDRSGSA